jgi:hypothetical protein
LSPLHTEVGPKGPRPVMGSVQAGFGADGLVGFLIAAAYKLDVVCNW